MIWDFILELLSQFKEAYPIFYIYFVVISIILIPLYAYHIIFDKTLIAECLDILFENKVITNEYEEWFIIKRDKND